MARITTELPALGKEMRMAINVPLTDADITLGQLNTAVKKLGGHKGLVSFLRGETALVQSRRVWRRTDDGFIRMSVTSRGMTGEEWIRHFTENCFTVEDYAQNILRSPDFIPTAGVTTEVEILPGEIFRSDERRQDVIRTYAAGCSLATPRAEVACLIREALMDLEIKAMGLNLLVVMHEPILSAAGGPSLLAAVRSTPGYVINGCYVGNSDRKWGSGVGFAFEVPHAA